MDQWLRRPPDWSVADAVTLVNAWLGTAAVLIAPFAPRLAIRVVLLAAVADGFDGLIARHHGGSALGPTLDSLSDAISFGLAPAAIAVGLASEWGGVDRRLAIALGGVAALLYVGTALLRLAMYTAEDVDRRATRGVPTTLAATILGGAILGVPLGPPGTVALTAVLGVLLITDVRYPDLIDRDSVGVAVLLTGTALLPTVAWRVWPRALLAVALVYLLAGPHVYDDWRRS